MKMKTQHLWDTMDVMRGKLIALSTYIKNFERSQINNLKMHLKKNLKKKTRTNPKDQMGRTN